MYWRGKICVAGHLEAIMEIQKCLKLAEDIWHASQAFRTEDTHYQAIVFTGWCSSHRPLPV